MHSEPQAATVTEAPNRAIEPNFYLLPFASQMIVWALRKRGSAPRRADGGTADEVMNVFLRADWGPLYSELLAVMAILDAAPAERPRARHAVACPCIAAHEAHLLNAVAHLRYGRRDEAVLSLCELLPPSLARLTLPHLAVIATTLTDANLRLAHVRLDSTGSAAGPRAVRDVH